MPAGNGFLSEKGEVSVLLFKVLHKQSHAGRGYSHPGLFITSVAAAKGHICNAEETHMPCGMLFSYPLRTKKNHRN